MTKIYQPLGVDVDTTTASATHELGCRAYGEDGTEWVYVVADEAITQYNAVAVVKDFGASKLTKALADAGSILGVAQVAFASGEYGWVLVRGGGNDSYFVTCKTGCLPNVGLYTSGTAGYLDDTSASQTAVLGIKLTDTATSSGAAEECFMFAELRAAATP